MEAPQANQKPARLSINGLICWNEPRVSDSGVNQPFYEPCSKLSTAKRLDLGEEPICSRQHVAGPEVRYMQSRAGRSMWAHDSTRSLASDAAPESLLSSLTRTTSGRSQMTDSVCTTRHSIRTLLGEDEDACNPQPGAFVGSSPSWHPPTACTSKTSAASTFGTLTPVRVPRQAGEDSPTCIGNSPTFSPPRLLQLLAKADEQNKLVCQRAEKAEARSALLRKHLTEANVKLALSDVQLEETMAKVKQLEQDLAAAEACAMQAERRLHFNKWITRADYENVQDAYRRLDRAKAQVAAAYALAATIHMQQMAAKERASAAEQEAAMLIEQLHSLQRAVEALNQTAGWLPEAANVKLQTTGSGVVSGPQAASLTGQDHIHASVLAAAEGLAAVGSKLQAAEQRALLAEQKLEATDRKLQAAELQLQQLHADVTTEKAAKEAAEKETAVLRDHNHTLQLLLSNLSTQAGLQGDVQPGYTLQACNDVMARVQPVSGTTGCTETGQHHASRPATSASSLFAHGTPLSSGPTSSTGITAMLTKASDPQVIDNTAAGKVVEQHGNLRTSSKKGKFLKRAAAIIAPFTSCLKVADADHVGQHLAVMRKSKKHMHSHRYNSSSGLEDPATNQHIDQLEALVAQLQHLNQHHADRAVAAEQLTAAAETREAEAWQQVECYSRNERNMMQRHAQEVAELQAQLRCKETPMLKRLEQLRMHLASSRRAEMQAMQKAARLADDLNCIGKVVTTDKAEIERLRGMLNMKNELVDKLTGDKDRLEDYILSMQAGQDDSCNDETLFHASTAPSCLPPSYSASFGYASYEP